MGLRYYESNVLRELMRAIIAADATNAEKLGGLIREWGPNQVNSVVDIIKTQIDIIEKLEQLLSSNKANVVQIRVLLPC